ncbi:maltose O-acetyltransferase [Mycobacteroides abscessus subsp. abscessus]|nr:maltose O-acetyltransferase [Mycobacteroides abscessus subsp. abscessus]
MKSEKEKMVNGDLYNPADPELVQGRMNARKQTRIFNESLETDESKRSILLK